MKEAAPHPRTYPTLLALFHKAIDGDDALLELAAERFKQAGLGTEFYAETPDALAQLQRYRPQSDMAATAHLSRELNLLKEESRSRVAEFAERFRNFYGLIVHDQPELVTRFDDYTAALADIESRLTKIGPGPFLFVEYACGVDPERFVRLFHAICGLQRVSSCIDIGHVGLQQVRAAFARRHPGADVCTIRPFDSQLPDTVEDVEKAVRTAMERVLGMIRDLGGLGKPLHFHLHDGHPLSTISITGVSDHIGFLEIIPIPFNYRGRQSLHPMFGPSGLFRIVSEAAKHLDPQRLSFALEIHPSDGRMPLGDFQHLFRHWSDKRHAEWMNFWLHVLIENHQLLLSACEAVYGDEARQPTADRRSQGCDVGWGRD